MIDDLEDFLVEDEFAVQAILDGGTILGIFLDPYQASQIGLVPMEASAPVFRCSAADAADVVHGDELFVGTNTYKVREIQPDGRGSCMLVLDEGERGVIWDDGETIWDDGHTIWTD